MQRIEDMGLAETFRLIERLPEGERRRRALMHALDELLEEEIEWRTGLRHQNVGWHKVSSVGGAGEGRGGCTGTIDHVGLAAERYIEESQWRTIVAALLRRLPERQRFAVLLMKYVLKPVNGAKSHRMMFQSEIISRQGDIARCLGLDLSVVRHAPFRTLKSIQRSSDRGKKKMYTDFLLYLIL